MKLFDPKILSRLSKNGIPKEEFELLLGSDADLRLELLKSQGMNIILHEEMYCFQSAITSVKDTLFCIVDVESNGSKPAHHQIIEIGAVKLQNGKIIDTYESLVYCTDISDQIQEITGIKTEQTLKAPAMSKVMREFRLFLGDAIFVGHDAKFDYNFVSAMMERVGLSKLLNRSLCTIDLAERTIESERYGLAYLNTALELYKEATHHRALSDAMTTTKLLKRVLNLLPSSITNSEELIAFSKEAKRLKRPKPKKEEKKETEEKEAVK
ncbi:Exonuclease RNase T and DNA polymerase III [Sulfuricurvum kujiense DSM 16994]|uniref:Exonuclease RNase T and DNA polymerase III n=1 Tax=Sulfuricurvum kujiense (strain ATCC BAA-921 / DSM 16994 / JCM 11577 / YK-1) TaxID=709032 RepID=E4TZ35_SULKY|nr:3'-5' exonuclease [Sulfuricurvum kujiense]ADR33034.1 Exonuclease RNase T and DNA polymerase III [Sulfuricurvum kujiense DSM 16994]